MHVSELLVRSFYDT